MANLSVPQQEDKKDSMVNPPLKSTEEYRLGLVGQFIVIALLIAVMYLMYALMIPFCPCNNKPLNGTLNGTAVWNQNLEDAERSITSWYPKDIFNRISMQTTVKRVELELDNNVKGHMNCFYLRNNVGTKKPPLTIVCPLKAPTKMNPNDVEVYRKSSFLMNGTLISSTIYTVSANGELQAREYTPMNPTADKLIESIVKVPKVAREPITQVLAPAAAPKFDETEMTVTSKRENLIDLNTAGVLKLIKKGNKTFEPETKDNAPTFEGSSADKLIFTVLKAMISEKKVSALGTTTDTLSGKPQGMATSTTAIAPKNTKDIEEATTSGTTTVISTSEAGKPVDADGKGFGAIAAIATEEKQADPDDQLQSVTVPKPVYNSLWKYLDDPRKIRTILKLDETNIASRFGSNTTVAG